MMLIELHIRNFALINSIDLEFYSGLNILTGETGAGKSIIIDSVNFMLGEKQTKEIIRSGENSAFVEAIFHINNDNGIMDMLYQYGIEADDILIISREINITGRSISRVNGRIGTLGMIIKLSRLLIDIHGQHEHQSLLEEESHIKILDSFCNDEFVNIKQEYKEFYIKIKEIDRELEKLKVDEQSKLRRLDLLKFQIQEINEAALCQGEEEELKKRKEILVNSEKIFSSLALCYLNLYEHEDRSSAYDNIGISISQLESIVRFDDKLKNINESLSDMYYKLEDIINNIRSYKESIDYDEGILLEIDSRLDLINKLKRKYGDSVININAFRDEISEESEKIEKSDEYILKLETDRQKCFDSIIKLANCLTTTRKDAAMKLENHIENELKYLGMLKSIFKIDITEADSILESGMDNVSFKISANPGEPPKALVKVASGGEMSRIMLAIKTVIADIDKIPTLIFDEIDTGISGRTAQAVAEKMSLISKKHQLLCVTHLPQIAAMADTHFRIEKITKEEKTSTIIHKLSEVERFEELARMLGGAKVTDITLKHAKEMIELAQISKSKI